MRRQTQKHSYLTCKTNRNSTSCVSTMQIFPWRERTRLIPLAKYLHFSPTRCAPFRIFSHSPAHPPHPPRLFSESRRRALHCHLKPALAHLHLHALCTCGLSLSCAHACCTHAWSRAPRARDRSNVSYRDSRAVSLFFARTPALR